MRESAFRFSVAALYAIGGGRLLRSAADRWAWVGTDGGRLKRRTGPPFLILIYHRVHPTPGPFMIDAVRQDRFERQMRHLARTYRPLPLHELVERSEAGAVPPGAVAITFDDGYADNFEHAFPILRRYQIPATVFLVTGCIGTGKVPWHDQVLLAFSATDRRTFRPVPVSRDEAPVSLATEEERRRAAFQTLAALKPMMEPDRLHAIAALREELASDTSPAEAGLMLDWDRIRAMRREGIRFGSHTETHPILSRVTPARALEEMTRSKRDIEAALGEEIGLFAYPNGRPGDFTAENVAQLKAIGYHAAVTTSFGANESGDDPYTWRRGTPWEENLSQFALKVAYYRLRAAEREGSV